MMKMSILIIYKILNILFVLLNQQPSTSCCINFPPGCTNLGNVVVLCTFKHYL